MEQTLFHLSFPVMDIARTKLFYVDGLGCGAGRETRDALILDLYGHQLVAHVVPEPLPLQQGIYPRHFGLVLGTETAWQRLLERAQQKQLTFYQQPKHRFPGTPLEHRTFFLQDPFLNFLEFKFYYQKSAIFGECHHAQVGDDIKD